MLLLILIVIPYSTCSMRFEVDALGPFVARCRCNVSGKATNLDRHDYYRPAYRHTILYQVGYDDPADTCVASRSNLPNHTEHALVTCVYSV